MRKNERENPYENVIKELEKHILEENDEHEEFAQKVRELVEMINSKEPPSKRGEYFFYAITQIVFESGVDTALAVATLESVKHIVLQRFTSYTALLTLEITRRLGLLGNEK